MKVSSKQWQKARRDRVDRIKYNLPPMSDEIGLIVGRIIDQNKDIFPSTNGGRDE